MRPKNPELVTNHIRRRRCAAVRPMPPAVAAWHRETFGLRVIDNPVSRAAGQLRAVTRPDDDPPPRAA